jgi:hypothetical protein
MMGESVPVARKTSPIEQDLQTLLGLPSPIDRRSD